MTDPYGSILGFLDRDLCRIPEKNYSRTGVGLKTTVHKKIIKGLLSAVGRTACHHDSL
jgi:hypothetical protein